MVHLGLEDSAVMTYRHHGILFSPFNFLSLLTQIQRNIHQMTGKKKKEKRL